MKKNYSFAKKMFATFLMTGIMVSLLMSSCKKYDDDIKGLQDQINQIASDAKDLKAKIGDNPVNAVAFDDKTGKLTITTPKGTVTYTVTSPVAEIKLENNKLYVNGVEKGSIQFPESSNVTVGADGYLYINGVKTGVLSADNIKGKAEVKADGYLYIDGVKTDMQIPPVVEVRADGFLYINGVKQMIKADLPNDVIMFNKDAKGNIISVTINQNGESITLANDVFVAPLAGLAFIPEMILDGVNAVDFGYINNVDDEPIMYSTPKANFRINPTQADLSKTTWKFLNRTSIIMTRASNDKYDLISASNEKVEGGVITFDLTMNNEASQANPAQDVYDIIALEATTINTEAKESKIVSDYVQTLSTQYFPFIGDKMKYDGVTAPKIEDYDLNTDLVEMKKWNAGGVPAVAADHKKVYGAKFDLLDYVMASANRTTVDNDASRKFFKDLNFNDYTYKFSKVSYLGPDGKTDQSHFTTLEGSQVAITEGTSAIGRFPLFKVEVMHKEKVVAEAYIKFEVTANTPSGNQEFKVTARTFEYKDLYAISQPLATDAVVIEWKEMNQLYAKMNMSHTEFINTYGSTTPSVVCSANIQPNHVILTLSKEQPNVDTYAMYLKVTPNTKFGTHTVTYRFAPANYPVLDVIFTVTVKAPEKAQLSTIYAPNGLAQTKGKFIGTDYKMQMSLNEAFVNYMVDYNKQFGNTNKLINNASHGFAFSFLADGTPVLNTNDITAATAPHALIFEDPANGGYMKQEIGLLAPLTTDSKTYNVVFRTVFQNKDEFNVPFKVQFNNPFTISLNPMAMETKTSATTLDIKEYLVVKLKELPLYDYSKKGTSGYDANGYHIVNCGSYGIATNGSALNYALKTTDVTGGNLTLSGSILTWDNKGADLFSDIISETVTTKVTTPYAERTTTPTVVTLKKNR